MRYTDPDGRIPFCVVTAGIGAGVGALYGAYKSYKKTGEVDWGEVGRDALIGATIGLFGGAITAEVVTSTALTAGSCTASYSAVMGSCTISLGQGLQGFKYAAKFGIDSYKNLKAALGTGSGLQVHHIIEQRLVKHLGININNMLSIVLTPEEHQKFTNLWRQAFSYGMDYTSLTKEEILKAAQWIYSDYPELLEATKKILEL